MILRERQIHKTRVKILQYADVSTDATRAYSWKKIEGKIGAPHAQRPSPQQLVPILPSFAASATPFPRPHRHRRAVARARRRQIQEIEGHARWLGLGTPGYWSRRCCTGERRRERALCGSGGGEGEGKHDVGERRRRHQVRATAAWERASTAWENGGAGTGWRVAAAACASRIARAVMEGRTGGER